MKKLAIIGASAALAALPVVGVFAADTDNATDTITVTVSDTCKFAATSTKGNTATFSLEAGQKGEEQAGSTFKVNCNDAKGWELKAKAGNTDATLTEADAGSAKPIATGTTLSGIKSAWAMKVTAGEGATVQDSFDAAGLHAVPGSNAEATVVKSSAASSEVEVKTFYNVYVSGDQPADTYTGSVVYTLSHPASAAGPGA